MRTLTIVVAIAALVPATVQAAAGTASPVDAAEGCQRPTALAAASVTDVPIQSGTCNAIRPGAQISSNIGLCTLAWILDGSDGKTYAATAGHCVDEGGDVRIDGDVIGTAVYSKAAPLGQDFAVIEIANGKSVQTSMCGWGAASGVFHGNGLELNRSAEERTVRHFGFGVGTGTFEPTRGRTGVLGYVNDNAFTFEGAVAPGDSGSPAMLENGKALGVITDGTAIRVPGNGGLPADPLLASGSVVGTRLDHGLAAAEADLGIDLSLAT